MEKKVPPRAVPYFDDYYMGLCYLIAARSKDPSTQQGAIIVDSKNIPIGWGYNGAAGDIRDNEINWNRPEKYPFIIHAEQNAFDHAYATEKLENGTIYITGFPCIECAKRIVNKRLRKIIYGQQNSAMISQQDRTEVVELCKLARVSLEEYKGNINWLRDAIEGLMFRLPKAF
jgi:dCMP deaminase